MTQGYRVFLVIPMFVYTSYRTSTSLPSYVGGLRSDYLYTSLNFFRVKVRITLSIFSVSIHIYKILVRR